MLFHTLLFFLKEMFFSLVFSVKRHKFSFELQNEILFFSGGFLHTNLAFGKSKLDSYSTYVIGDKY
jgi:hypothetical protein